MELSSSNNKTFLEGIFRPGKIKGKPTLSKFLIFQEM